MMKVLVMLALGALATAAVASEAPQVERWSGPKHTPLPGPGPKPSQPLADYFKSLKTGPRTPQARHVLVLGGSRGFHHDSISTAMAAIHRLGRETGDWDAELRTDFALVNPGGGNEMNAGFQPEGLRDFDAIVVVSAEGGWGLAPVQKAALISFVRDTGKGLVVIHGGLAANSGWPEWARMLGGASTGHPFNTLEQVLRPFDLVNEGGDHPVTSALPPRFVKRDELYVIRDFSRSDSEVLLRLDESKLDFRGLEDQAPPDRDIPIAWTRSYGRGRVFASSLGHSRESFDDPDIVQFYGRAIQWALGLTSGGRGPHPRP